jgi:hypothetical protein
MLGVLLAANGGWRDDVNLVGGAAALHGRWCSTWTVA